MYVYTHTQYNNIYICINTHKYTNNTRTRNNPLLLRSQKSVTTTDFWSPYADF